jgi:hypothetical protein
MSDEEYLHRQAADARAAIGGTGRWVLSDLERTFDPRKFLKRAEAHLWTLGAIVAASGLAASALFGRRHSTSNGHGEPASASTPPPIPPESKSDRRQHKVENIVPIMTELLALARPVIAAIGAVAAARADKSNGQPAPGSPPRRRRPRKST